MSGGVLHRAAYEQVSCVGDRDCLDLKLLALSSAGQFWGARRRM